MTEADKSQWTPRTTSIVCEGKTLWFSHSSFGAMLGVFYTKAQADYASSDYDIKLTLKITTNPKDDVQIIRCEFKSNSEIKVYGNPPVFNGVL